MEVSSSELYYARRKAEKDAGFEINHIGSAESEFMSDRHVCSCGWESPWYWDGAPFAQQDWVKHIQEQGGEINYPQAV